MFLYDDASADQLLRTLGDYAADPDLSFTWYDAAVMSQRIAKLREQYQGTPSATDRPRFKERTT